MLPSIINHLAHLKSKNKKGFAVLIDPDDVNWDTFHNLINISIAWEVSYFFIGGSLITNNISEKIIATIKEVCTIPTVLFPGSCQHFTPNADAILFLSLLSGRNPDFLIGQHVIAAPILKKSQLEILPTAYLLIDGGKPTTVSYISNTTPIPSDKPAIAACTAMAGEMLGFKMVFMDAGSGAENHVPAKMIEEVRKSVDIPIIVGGGINTGSKAKAILAAGADIVVIGNGVEKSFDLIREISEVVQSLNTINLVAELS
jgi:putative glycerol-1-phosphate prenyltransferase